MACGACSRNKNKNKTSDGLAYSIVFGNYGYLTDRQLKARLENYKRNYCKECDKRYECDLSIFVTCKNIKNI